MDFEDVGAFASLDDESLDNAMVDELCSQYDPAQFIPPWMRERGDPANWEAYLRVDRLELREELKVAVMVGGILEHLAYPWTGQPGFPWAADEEVRLQLFYGLVGELTMVKEADKPDYAAAARLSENFSMKESDRLREALQEASEAACRRALLIDGRPQASAS